MEILGILMEIMRGRMRESVNNTERERKERMRKG